MFDVTSNNSRDRLHSLHCCPADVLNVLRWTPCHFCEWRKWSCQTSKWLFKHYYTDLKHFNMELISPGHVLHSQEAGKQIKEEKWRSDWTSSSSKGIFQYFKHRPLEQSLHFRLNQTLRGQILPCQHQLQKKKKHQRNLSVNSFTGLILSCIVKGVHLNLKSPLISARSSLHISV